MTSLSQMDQDVMSLGPSFLNVSHFGVYSNQALTQAPLRLDEAMQASTKATPFTPSWTLG